EAFSRRKQRKLAPYAEACKKRFTIDWKKGGLATPSFTGARVLRDFPLSEIVPYIDWSPFFMAWELAGKYPFLLDDQVVGAQARNLFNDANRLLERFVRERLVKANAVYGFFPANSDGDDVIVWTDESRQEESYRFHFLRQQWEREGQTSFRCLADYIAPVGQ